ncbi:glycoside hydrolase family 1 protein [Actinomyces minihominis]|uniref:glycoside hydrolase family 1 protein n=1 Tax=Actinomyces minihominis TaxID=2002838 RepID=UPI000C08A14E|nr:family 1 glycosylhydrolase [Actinomyces minihominis]
MTSNLIASLEGARTGTPRPFPKDFLLGAAAAAYQIEGAVDEDGRGPSIWDVFSGVPGAIVNGETGAVACDHYHRYREDVALMKELGLQTYRFSTSWARVCPDGVHVNQKGLDFYSRLVDELLRADILPWLTLYHWDLPQALQDEGGWPNRDTAYRFRDYALTVHDALHDRVRVWTTLNEPWCSSFLSYTGGEHAPGHRSLTEGLLASHHLLLGHGLAAQALNAVDPEAQLGLTLNFTVAQPLDPKSAGDQRAARLVDGQMNRWFLDPLFRCAYPRDIIAELANVEPAAVTSFEDAVRPGDLSTISTPIDTLGVNYYQGDLVASALKVPDFLTQQGVTEINLAPSGGAPLTRPVTNPMRASRDFVTLDALLPKTAQNWDVDPLMLTDLLERLHNEYTKDAGVTLYVTENGAAYDDEVTPGAAVLDPERTAYLESHLGAVLDALDRGVNINGFMYWSLMDNYEWAWGYNKRFGLVYVDYETQRRIIKQSGRAYAKIIAARALDMVPQAGLLIRQGTLVSGRESSNPRPDLV